MIRYALQCDKAHPFEGWFGSSADYETQAECGQVSCPICGSRSIEKQIMAPNVVGAKKRSPDDPAEVLRRVRVYVEENFEDVGDAFAKEALDIHQGRSPERLIYGEATPEDVADLIEAGAPIAPMPPKLPDKGDLN